MKKYIATIKFYYEAENKNDALGVADVIAGEVERAHEHADRYSAIGTIEAQVGDITQEHELSIKSLHDAIADCSCGWHYAYTGGLTAANIEAEHAKHLIRVK